MKHTSATTLVSAAALGGVLLWALQALLSAAGSPALVPPWTWGVALGLVGGVMTSLAWPIRQSMVGKGSAGLVDPFYATRVVLLAKSSTIAGALFLGAALGAGVFFFSRPVVAEVSLWLTLVALGGAIVLMAGGALAERWCTLPPDSSEPGAPVVPEGDVG